MTAPPWLSALTERAATAVDQDATRLRLPAAGQPGARASAVLLLFAGTSVQAPAAANIPGLTAADSRAAADVPTATGRSPGGSERGPGDVGPAAAEISILLTERAHSLRSHPGQVSFPGGRAEPSDADLVATALREAQEEVGVEPESVEVAGVLPSLNLSVSAHDVSPVLGWWRRPGGAWVRDPGEVARVLQVPIADLIDPANRFRVSHHSGWVGPAFQAQDLVVWGFTAMLLDSVLRLGGWEIPWDASDVRPPP